MVNSQVLYKEPIKVICINSSISIKLIQNATYLAISMYTGKSGERVTYIKDVGFYSNRFFTLIDGNPLDSLPDFFIENGKKLDTKNINYTGQLVKCRHTTGKSLKSGEIYYVEKQVKSTRNNYKGIPIDTYKFKLRGIRNVISEYRFEQIPIAEQRRIKLKNLNVQKTKTGEQTRKFLLYTDKQRISILFDLLCRVLIDINKVESNEKINITELILSRGDSYAINKDDITKFLKEDIKKTLEPYNFDY